VANTHPDGGRPETAPVWHALLVDDIARRLDVDPAAGLPGPEVAERAKRFGPNVLPEAEPPAAWRVLLGQFASLLVAILLGAALVSLVLGDVLEFASILVITVLNAVFGFAQEYRAERALGALRALSAPGAVVRREGTERRIPAAEVVPGDILLFEAGDVIAADARIVDATSLAVSEASLTGESLPVDKSADPSPEGAALGDRTSMVYQATIVARGHGQAIVVATGRRTEVGHIAGLVAGHTEGATRLQRELASVGRVLAVAAGAVCIVVFVLGLVRGLDVETMFLVAASLGVAAIPEGLPAASTVVLALGVQRMARRRAIVRRLSSVETLGAVTTIFTDKTGTLTENRMTVTAAWTANGADRSSHLRASAVLCNNATLAHNGGSTTGDPTEVALLEWAAAQGVDIEGERRRYSRESELPFDTERKRMTVVVRDPDGRRLALVKGAPEVLAERSNDGAGRASLEAEDRRLAAAGSRVLAFAQRELHPGEEGDALEQDLDLVGLIAMADPLRAEAEPAIKRARAAGIRVVMLTGDQPVTARAIAGELGLPGDVVTGVDIETAGEEELAARAARAGVFARVTSEHKLRIIEAARHQGEVVAMTGDGVNDAPALQAADIGVAMGRIGTDVARQAADMVLTDDNFRSIVDAVEEGRTIHGNIKRFIHFLLSCNVGEILVVFIALAAFGEQALTPLQILFVNLLTDGLPALALGVEPAHEGVMHRKPRPQGEMLIGRRSLIPIAGIGGLVAVATLAAFGAGLARADAELGGRLAFAALVGSQLAASLVFRSETQAFFRLPPNRWLTVSIGVSMLALLAVFYLPVLQEPFGTRGLTAGEWALVAGLSMLPLGGGELAKAVLRRRPAGSGPAAGA
jgi:Ca2+-transporting ATPase